VLALSYHRCAFVHIRTPVGMRCLDTRAEPFQVVLPSRSFLTFFCLFNPCEFLHSFYLISFSAVFLFWISLARQAQRHQTEDMNDFPFIFFLFFFFAISIFRSLSSNTCKILGLYKLSRMMYDCTERDMYMCMNMILIHGGEQCGKSVKGIDTLDCE
jgi:hypothetical protein